MLDFQIDNYLLFDTLKREVGVSSTSQKVNIRCPVCGDSSESKHKSRGWLIFDRSRDLVYYKCFNGGCDASDKAWNGMRFLKFVSPNEHRRLKRQFYFKTNKSTMINKVDLRPIPDVPETILVDTSKFKELFSDDIDKSFKTLIKNFIIERKIPLNKAKEFLFCDDGDYYGRIIIPFINEDKKIEYFISRSLIPNHPVRYKNPTDIEKKIYNFDFIDTKKPVVIFEGVINSFFVDNSIATLGTGFGDKVEQKIYKHFKQRYWLLDNDEAGKKSSLKLLENKEKVFLWSKFLKDQNLKDINDINDLVMFLDVEKIEFEFLKPWFSNSYYDRLYLKI